MILQLHFVFTSTKIRMEYSILHIGQLHYSFGQSYKRDTRLGEENVVKKKKKNKKERNKVGHHVFEKLWTCKMCFFFFCIKYTEHL